jgi:hypothetical protein
MAALGLCHPTLDGLPIVFCAMQSLRLWLFHGISQKDPKVAIYEEATDRKWTVLMMMA